MIHTPFCDLLNIAYPIMQASIGPWSSIELTAAVSNAGGLGSLGTALQSADALKDQVARLRDLTEKPFVINHTMRPFDEEMFAAALDVKPAAVSLALGDPGDLVRRAHDAGILFIQQVHTIQQAEQAVERGADVIIAQSGEAGGFGGSISTFVLVPQVVDAVRPIPVLAAGGIADGRGLAAALVLGAQGINIGTRFVASEEAAVDPAWKEAIITANAEDAVQSRVCKRCLSIARTRRLRDSAACAPHAVCRRVEPAARRGSILRCTLWDEVRQAVQQGRAHEIIPFAGQTAGLIHEILPAGEIVRRIAAESEEALKKAAFPIA